MHGETKAGVDGQKEETGETTGGGGRRWMDGKRNCEREEREGRRSGEKEGRGKVTAGGNGKGRRDGDFEGKEEGKDGGEETKSN